jgi:hypothetical protein
MTWEDFDRDTPVERVSAMLVARATPEYDPDDPPTRQTPIDLAAALRSASASHLPIPTLGARRAFGEEATILAHRPPPPIESPPPTPPSPLFTPSAIRIWRHEPTFVPPTPPETMRSVVVVAPPPLGLRVARALVIGIASAVTITAVVAAWRVVRMLHLHM